MADKPKFTPEFKSVFSMGQLDFERYHKTLCILDDLAVSIGIGNYYDIGLYYQHLRGFYRSIRKLIHKHRKPEEETWCQDDFKKAFDLIKPEVERIRKNIGQDNKFSFDKKVIDILEEIHDQLMDLKQLVGLGIEVRRELTGKQLMKQAFRGSD